MSSEPKESVMRQKPDCNDAFPKGGKIPESRAKRAVVPRYSRTISLQMERAFLAATILTAITFIVVIPRLFIYNLVNTGVSLHQRGELPAALRHYDWALFFAPTHAAALAHKGRALQALGREAEALELLRAATQADAGNSEVRLELASALHAAHLCEEALPHLRVLLDAGTPGGPGGAVSGQAWAESARVWRDAALLAGTCNLREPGPAEGESRGDEEAVALLSSALAATEPLHSPRAQMMLAEAARLLGTWQRGGGGGHTAPTTDAVEAVSSQMAVDAMLPPGDRSDTNMAAGPSYAQGARAEARKGAAANHLAGATIPSSHGQVAGSGSKHEAWAASHEGRRAQEEL
eukprot:jgi/Mesvir1/26594/Mv09565-RA.1